MQSYNSLSVDLDPVDLYEKRRKKHFKVTTYAKETYLARTSDPIPSRKVSRVPISVAAHKRKAGVSDDLVLNDTSS